MTIGGDGTNSEFDGSIQDENIDTTATFGVTKTGAGTLTLGGYNWYNGPTVINQGTLAVNGTIAPSTYTGAASVGVTVGNDSGNAAALAGTGAIDRNVTVKATGNVSPAGNGTVGTLLINGNLTMNAGSDLDFDLGSAAATYDQIAMGGGTITLNGKLLVNPLSGFALGGTYALITYPTTAAPPSVASMTADPSSPWPQEPARHSSITDLAPAARRSRSASPERPTQARSPGTAAQAVHGTARPTPTGRRPTVTAPTRSWGSIPAW